MTHGAVRAPQRSPATKVWVFQWPKGAFERRRPPFAKRPRATRHLRVGSRLVEENQPVRLGSHPGLPFSLPRLARLAHVGPIAFAGLKAFFLKLRPFRMSQWESEAGSAFTPLAAKSSAAS